MARREAHVNERMRRLPAVDVVLARLTGAPHQVLVDAARRAVEAARVAVRNGDEAPDLDSVVREAHALLKDHERALLRPVINATGVLIHTNLGRAPLGESQLEAVRRVAGGYSNLEYDLGGGVRGDRYLHARSLLTHLTGAESALVVNNNAAAVLLALTALCRGREVIISRGELIEIGGGFRIPDVMAQSGARLVEVGTTNRTDLADYERAITPETAAILKVHTSNYRIVGFTRAVDVASLARLARGRGVLLLNDLGSGMPDIAKGRADVRDEPAIGDALSAGVDVALVSGDKLLGGPQAGIIVGRRDLIAKMGRNPLLRALRVDKMTLAALEATLDAWLEQRLDDIPLWTMLTAPANALRARATRIAEKLNEVLPAFEVGTESTESVTGGGSLPGQLIDSWAVTLSHRELGPDHLQTLLRKAPIPVIGRVEEGRLLLDLRSVAGPLDDELTTGVAHALSSASST